MLLGVMKMHGVNMLTMLGLNGHHEACLWPMKHALLEREAYHSLQLLKSFQMITLLPIKEAADPAKQIPSM